MGKVTPEYNLAVIHPKVAKEWHKTKNNSLTSKDVTPGSQKKVWWQCNKNHEWEAIVGSRSKGNGCPECAGKKVGKDNNLFVKLPKVAKEWHKTKNNSLTPKDVTPGSRKRVWWQCNKGHEWEVSVKERLRGRNCPICRPNISKIQIQIFCELKIIFEDILLEKKIDGIECDIYLPSLKTAVEYDGYRWHKGNEKRDSKKNAELKNKGVTLFRIREPKLEKISHNDILIKSGESTISVIKRLLIKLFKKHSFSSTQIDQFNKYLVRKSLL
jgi:hypothetical protein